MKEIIFKPEESKFIKSMLRHFISEHEPLKSESIDISKKIINKLERAEKTIKVSSRKGKGRNLQYWVCERIAKIFNIEFNQNDDCCLIHSREMGQHGTDIIVRGDLYKKFPFDIECKSCETLSIPSWVRQARENNKKEDRSWLVVFKKQTIGGEPLVIMDWSCFEKLVKGNKND